MSADLSSVAVYERTIGASLERVWENVHDWEHLPWLHAGSFERIALVERGDWGWRARIGLPRGREILLELVKDGDDRYVSRTLEGSGAGTEVWTTVTPQGPDRTGIRVEFLVPDVSPAEVARVGGGFTRLYTRLWDEDEAMMQQRAVMLVRERGGEPSGLDLGPEAEVRARVPFVVDLSGARFRVVLVSDELLAHSVVCPHWLGPLDARPVEGGVVTCPWHGYRFDVTSGRRCDTSSPMRLAPAPKLVVDAASGHVWLEPAAS